VLCQLLLALMHDGERIGRDIGLPVIGHAALYRMARSCSVDGTDAVR